MSTDTNAQRTVLIIDGDGEVAERAAASLQGRGYATGVVHDIASALLVLRRSDVAMIVLDLCVENALEFLDIRAADERLSRIPLMVVTVAADEPLLRETLAQRDVEAMPVPVAA